MINVEQIKKDFPIFDTRESLIYLDNASSSQTPKCVLDAELGYYTRYRANINRGLHTMSENATDAYEKARETVADFIGVSNQEIVFTSGATQALNLAILSLEYSGVFSSGDRVVSSVLDHHSVLVPLQQLAKRNTLDFICVPIKKDFSIDTKKAVEIITKDTKLVILTLASNVTGGIQDLTTLIEHAHGVGAFVLLDMAQAIGHISVDIQKLNCDMAVFSGHKMFGPTGTGVLYAKKILLENLEPANFGGGSVESVTLDNTIFKEVPYKFESGTPNIAGIIGLGSAVNYINTIGTDIIHMHTTALVQSAQVLLAKIDGVKLFSSESLFNSGIVSFTIDGIHPHDINEIANRNHVAIRSGNHCAGPLMHALNVQSVSRASFHIYNSKNDVEALANCVKEAKRFFDV